MTTKPREHGHITIGMDLGDRSRRYCGVDADGMVVEEGRCATRSRACAVASVGDPPSGSRSRLDPFGPGGPDPDELEPRSAGRESATTPRGLREGPKKRSCRRGMAGPRRPAGREAPGSSSTAVRRRSGRLGGAPITGCSRPRLHATRQSRARSHHGLRRPTVRLLDPELHPARPEASAAGPYRSVRARPRHRRAADPGHPGIRPTDRQTG